VHTRNLEQNKQGGYEITYMSCVENAKFCEKHVVVLRLLLLIHIHIPNTKRDDTFKKKCCEPNGGKCSSDVICSDFFLERKTCLLLLFRSICPELHTQRICSLSLYCEYIQYSVDKLCIGTYVCPCLYLGKLFSRN
jgi:hypothetical protein